jgi:transcriptional regulator with PAS, ATPase and Fis domain
MCNAAQIGVEHLPEFLHEISSKRIARDNTSTNDLQNKLASQTELNLNALETRAIREALASAGGNRTAAAEMLGISRRTLQRKLKEG